MPLVILPTGGIAQAEPRFIDRGGVLRATLGGNDQRLDRLGSKWGCSFTTRPMKADDARIWIARLIAGKSNKVAIRFPQPGLANQFTINGTVQNNTPANGTQLGVNINVSHNGKYLREGQFFTIITGGQRYLYQATKDAVVVAGVLGIDFQPALRVAVVAGDTVGLSDPYIEGYVQGDDLGWSVDNAKIYGLQFEIEEAG